MCYIQHKLPSVCLRIEYGLRVKKISLVHLVPDVAASSHVTGMLMINEQKSLYIQENFTLLCINHGTKASFEGFFLMALILQNEFNQFFNHSYNGMPDALKHLLTPTWTCLVCSERQGWMTWDWAYTNTQEITEQCNFCIHWEYLRIGKSFHWSGNDSADTYQENILNPFPNF